MRKTKSKGLIALLIIAALILSIAVSRVSAENEYSIVFSISDSVEGEHSIEVSGGHLKIDGNFVDPRLETAPDDNSFNGYSVVDNGDGTITMTITSGQPVVLNFNNGNNYKLSSGQQSITPDTVFSTGANITVEDYVDNTNNSGTGNNQGENNGGNNQGENNGGNNQGEGQNTTNNNFDGNAYFVWVTDGNICYHKFLGLAAGSEMNYISVNELTDDSGNSSNYTWGQEPANWVLASSMEDNNGNIKPDLTQEYIFGNQRDEMGVQLDPCGAEDGANSICTNADRNFRATIYRDNYEALVFGITEADYTYFPSFWDPTFFTSTIDVSNTSKSNPAVYTTYLLEPTIRFKTGIHSKSNDITSVKALDVNPEAVSIAVVDGEYRIGFNSKYYDHVVFQVTTADGNSYYIKLARTTMNIHDNFGPGVTNKQVRAQLFFPSTKSHDDYEVVATKVYSDGSTQTVKPAVTTVSLEEDPGLTEEQLGNTEMKGGKNLKYSVYAVSVDDSVVGVYFTVVNDGALDGDTYGGTFSGSGIGAYYDLNRNSSTFRKTVIGK